MSIYFYSIILVISIFKYVLESGNFSISKNPEVIKVSENPKYRVGSGTRKFRDS